jgi:hypothetical protein
MTRLRAAASAVIDARPEDVYGVIADYRDGHPHILPRENFQDLKVEEGGRGAGTVISFVTVSGGMKRPFRVKVSEPQPGRVLQENDTASSLVTTFTVTPEDDGRRSRVQIATEWDASKGPMGVVERLLYPGGMRRIYEKELRQLAGFMASKRGS